MSHQDKILDQFTRQAVPFARSSGVRSEDALRLAVEFTEAGPDDVSLDVACGPGLLVCAFAKVVRHAFGIDLTPAMLEQAQREAQANGLSNVVWHRGDATSLPYADNAFNIVTSRFTFHHLPDPLAALREMKRVCAPGGRVAVIDSSPEASKALAFNRMETLRDPSHVRAMPLHELKELFRDADMSEPRTTAYRLQGDLDGLLSRSFPNPGDDLKIRGLFEAAEFDDSLDMDVRRDGALLLYGHPVALLVTILRSARQS